jgi:hypothetical protein
VNASDSRGNPGGEVKKNITGGTDMDNKELKEFYEKLSDEAKEKIRACKNEEEMKKVLEDMKIELPRELLDAVSGGAGENTPCPYLYCAHCGCN